MNKSKVYFTKEISPASLVKIYECLEKDLKGNVAIKISTGEPGGKNFLNPNLIKKLVDKLNGTIVECNTAYAGRRNNTEEHYKAIKEHGFMDIAKVDIMDEYADMAIPVKNGIHLKENYVGKNLEKYDSMLVLSHFKGHQMGGFGGALKNMSIGVASSSGKAWIHTAGKTKNPNELWDNLPEQDHFLESMAEADESVIDYMNKNIVYINVLNNLSIDCDCNSNPEAPCMNDIGITASIDPVALDKASLDLIYNSKDKGKDKLIARIEKMHGIRIIEHAVELGIGTINYELVHIDNDSSDDLDIVKKRLYDTKASLVVMFQNKTIKEYYGSRVNDIVSILEENKEALRDAVVADKVIGKVAATLLSLAGVKEIYADVISEFALPVLDVKKIKYNYKEKVEYIINNNKTGMCPMENKFKNEVELEKIYNYFIKNYKI